MAGVTKTLKIIFGFRLLLSVFQAYSVYPIHLEDDNVESIKVEKDALQLVMKGPSSPDLDDCLENQDWWSDREAAKNEKPETIKDIGDLPRSLKCMKLLKDIVQRKITE